MNLYETVTDKGGEFVIPRQLDIAITNNHLEDASLYRSSSVNEFKKQNRKLKHEWDRTAKAVRLTPSIISQLKIQSPTCPVLNLLIKTHKLVSTDDLRFNDPSIFKVRPIFSCVGRPNSMLLNVNNIPQSSPSGEHSDVLGSLCNANPNNAYVM
ncbi:hypothetical protein KIN20_011335 [Parelaphostrongylus tenuis]|uniref:Uncharacterized protein n=1 Tax=Parelaphostrongylus tenuis TaxID=148309 RepID=A0AAD5M988_PARTN|nr:hypothetical protein KIN20_011335 [Parelaphostrongylus tenuis]